VIETSFKLSTRYCENIQISLYDQNYDQQAKDTLFRNRLQRLLFLVSVAGYRIKYERRKFYAESPLPTTFK